MKVIALESLLKNTQQYISANYATALIDTSKGVELKAYIGKYLYDTGYTVEGYTRDTLIARLYREMAE